MTLKFVGRISFARLPEVPPGEILAHMSDARIAEHMPLLTFAWDVRHRIYMYRDQNFRRHRTSTQFPRESDVVILVASSSATTFPPNLRFEPPAGWAD